MQKLYQFYLGMCSMNNLLWFQVVVSKDNGINHKVLDIHNNVSIVQDHAADIFKIHM